MNEAINSDSVDSAITLFSMTKALLIMIAGWLIANAAERFFKKSAALKITPHSMAMYSRLIFYGLIGLFFVTAIDQLGFDITVLLGAAGIFTVAIGFASQTSASNLISGLFLLGEKPFQVGDVLRVGSDSGEVISIDLLSVKLRTFDNLFVRIPNESLIKSTVINVTKFPIRRIDLTVGVAYKENLESVTQLLLTLADNELRVLEEPQPFCIATNFGTSSMDLQLSVWCRREIFRDLKSDLIKQVKATFDEQGIEIPFPHVSVYAGSQTAPLPIQQTTGQP